MWNDLSAYRYTDGCFLLGIYHLRDGGNHPVGIKTNRHAITVAGSRSGKGVAVIIPNLLRWKQNALVVDPKGEAVNETANQREAMGQAVHVLDPFGRSSWADKGASYNPLADLDMDGVTIREDIEVLADGIVLRRPSEKDSHWDDGAGRIVAGVIAMVMLRHPAEEQNLVTVRSYISDKGKLDELMEEAKSVTACGNLPQNGASAYFAQEGGYYVSNAEKHTNWLDSAPIQSVLRTSSFSLSDIKSKPTTVYLVLPPKYLTVHGRFLRLMVRSSLEVMQTPTADGKEKDKQCLFLLDEFFALGYIGEIATGAGLMAGYGLQLWPFVQDLEQLNQLYGEGGAQTFFGNSDVHQFFGNMDAPTLNYISNALGVKNETDAYAHHKGAFIPQEEIDEARRFDDRTSRDAIEAGVKPPRKTRVATLLEIQQQTLDRVQAERGKTRLPPDEVAQFVGNEDDGSPISFFSIVFIPGRKRLAVPLLPFWLMDRTEWEPRQASQPRQQQRQLPTYRPSTLLEKIGDKLAEWAWLTVTFIFYLAVIAIVLLVAFDVLILSKGTRDTIILISLAFGFPASYFFADIVRRYAMRWLRN